MSEMTPDQCWVDGCDPEILMLGKFCRWCHAKKPHHASDCAVPPWEADRRDARRYRWLRGDGRTPTAYAPEEEGVWGGDELDALCDAALAAKENA